MPAFPALGTKGLLLNPLRVWTSHIPRIGASEAPLSSAAAAWARPTAPTTVRATKVAVRDRLRQPRRAASRICHHSFHSGRPPWRSELALMMDSLQSDLNR